MTLQSDLSKIPPNFNEIPLQICILPFRFHFITDFFCSGFWRIHLWRMKLNYFYSRLLEFQTQEFQNGEFNFQGYKI